MTDLNYTRLCAISGSERLDKLLASALPGFSRALVQRLIDEGGARVGGQVCKRPAQKVSRGDELAVDVARLAAFAPPQNCQPEAMALDIIYEDDALLIINKPAGLVTHPGHGNYHGTLQAGLMHHHRNEALARGGIVHRLDKDTSGLMAVAKTAPAQRHLIEQFKTREIRREYSALVYGEAPATGVIERPMRRSRADPLRMEVAPAGGGGSRDALTRYHRERAWRGFSLLRCRLLTGRTHQIRAHLEYAGYPLVGDKVYRRRARPLPFAVPRQMLHARRLRLIHPQSNKPREWSIETPPDMQAVIDQIDQLNT